MYVDLLAQQIQESTSDGTKGYPYSLIASGLEQCRGPGSFRKIYFAMAEAHDTQLGREGQVRTTAPIEPFQKSFSHEHFISKESNYWHQII